jgi:hypothetical protein
LDETVRLEKMKTDFMEMSITRLRAHIDAVAVKLEAELGQWYNIVPDSLHFSNFYGTLSLQSPTVPLYSILFYPLL